jgi:hypothetical protein
MAEVLEMIRPVNPDYISLGKDGSKWKHGYIPENAAAVALKHHKKPGGHGSSAVKAKAPHHVYHSKESLRGMSDTALQKHKAAHEGAASRARSQASIDKHKAQSAAAKREIARRKKAPTKKSTTKKAEPRMAEPKLVAANPKVAAAARKKVMARAKKATDYVHRELPKTDLTDKKKANVFFRGLYKILPGARKKIESARKGKLHGRLKEINYVEKVISAIIEESTKQVLGLGVAALFSYIGIRLGAG